MFVPKVKKNGEKTLIYGKETPGILSFRCLAAISKDGKDYGCKSRQKIRRVARRSLAVDTDKLPVTSAVKPVANIIILCGVGSAQFPYIITRAMRPVSLPKD